MDVSKIIARPRDFIGCDTSVRGCLLVGADSRLVADENRPEEQAILLPHPATADRLLAAVPPYGGGRYIYAEDATVVGTLSDDLLRFATVRRLIIRRGGEQVWGFVDVSQRCLLTRRWSGPRRRYTSRAGERRTRRQHRRLQQQLLPPQRHQHDPCHASADPVLEGGQRVMV
ncbi:MAG TPA: hypothetical protein VGN72_00030 [Tepidisphaeraceae bacterium]|jgi:hypothetical protein|nr:hypothetical protein [Tepidisphaeraceae bacterium]